MVAQPGLAQRHHGRAARLLDGGVRVEQRLLVRAKHREGAGRRQVPEQRQQYRGGVLLASHDQPVHAVLHHLEGLNALFAEPLPVRHSLTRSTLFLALLLRL